MRLSFLVCSCILSALTFSALNCIPTGGAKNIILFLADGTGFSTINAASIYGYGKPQQLFIQNMPHLGLSETSTASNWVTDSAAGMTAIMTGEKTHNGVVSQASNAVRGKKDGTPLKSILEYAEERGLSSGVVSNSPISDATPAACYAHSNDRGKHGHIFAQILEPRFGDGVDVVIGPGRKVILQQTQELNINLEEELTARGYAFIDNPQLLQEVASQRNRIVALYESEDFDLGDTVSNAIDILKKNTAGFFLMVESNNHFSDAKKSLSRLVAMDKVVRETSERMKNTDTLILFTADHSYDLRIPLAPKVQDIVPHVVIDGHHTAEEVLVAAQGPGAEQVKGFFPNTRLFRIMMEAYRWQ